MSEPLKQPPHELGGSAAGPTPPARRVPHMFRADVPQSWRPGPRFWTVALTLAAMVLVGLFAFAHYELEQAPHRLWKALFGMVVAVLFVFRPGLTLYALPFAFAWKEMLPVTPIPLLNAMNLLTYVLMITWVANAALQKRPMFERSLVTVPLALYLGWTALSWVHGELEGGYGVPIQKSIQAFWNHMSGFVLFFPLLFTIRTMKQVRVLTICFCLGAASGVFSLLSEYAEYGGDHRVAGAIGDLNIAGAFYAVLAVFTLGMLRVRGISLWSRLGVIGATVGSVTSVLLTGSRGALLALTLGSLPQALRAGAVGFLSVALLGLGLTVGAPDMVKERVQSTVKAFTQGENPESGTTELESVDATSGGRLQIWGAVLTIVAQKPLLGVGLYRLAQTVEESIGRYKVAHNLYLELLGESGVPCLLIFLFWMWRCVKGGNELSRFGGFSGGLGSAYVYAVVALLVANFFGQRLSHFSVSGAFSYLTALVVRAHQLESDAAAMRARVEPAAG